MFMGYLRDVGVIYRASLASASAATSFVNPNTVLDSPINQVFDGSNVPAAGDLRVARLPQIARETFK